MAKLIGKSWSETKSGKIGFTLYLEEDFSAYYKDPTNGRGCVGKSCSSIYVADYDCSTLEVGAEIEIYYDRAVTTTKGVYQSIKSIEVVN